MKDGKKMEKNIFFIYSQLIEEKGVHELEKNVNIENIEAIKKWEDNEFEYTLYSLALSNNKKEKTISLFLQKSGETYFSTINCFKIYPKIFLYKVEFKPFNVKTLLPSKPFILPYKEQFFIFIKNIVIQDNFLLKNLCLSTLDLIHNISSNNIKEDASSKNLFDFDFYLYLFLNCLHLLYNNKNQNIVKYFFNEFNIDLIDVDNSFDKEKSNKLIIEEIINKETLNSLSDFNEMRKIILSIDDKEETFNNKLELILAYYYIKYNPRLFIKFISDYNKRKEEIKLNLRKNRKLFKNFTSDILNFDLFNEAENYKEIFDLFLLVPNMPEFLKILSIETFYSKLVYICQIENKVYALDYLVSPNKEDNIDLLKKNFLNLKAIALKEYFYAFVLSNNFF